MNHYLAKQKGKPIKDRPGSERLRDLHIYLVPREKWQERRQLAETQAAKYTISMGFVRVIPEITLTDLRYEVGQQLRDDLMPENFVFLRKVGRDYTQVKPNQELQMKVKYYFPPNIMQPEIFVLEGSYISRLSSSIENSDAEEVQGKSKKGKKHTSLNASKNFRASRFLSEKNNAQKSFSNQRGKKNSKSEVLVNKNITTETKLVKKSKMLTENDNQADHEQTENFEQIVDTAADSWIDSSSNPDLKSGKVSKKAKQNGAKSKNIHSKGIKARPKLPIYSKYKSMRGSNKSRNNSIKKKAVEMQNEMKAEDLTIEEKIEMLTSNQSDEDKEVQENTEDMEDHVVMDDDDVDAGDSSSQVDSSKLKIDVNAELIDGGAMEGNEVKLSLEEDDSESSERQELLDILNKVQKERFQLEDHRKELITHLKKFQENENLRRRKVKEEWKSRYLEAKRATPHLEESCAKLKLELEKIHRNFLSEHESRQKKKRNTNGKSGDRPSQKTTHKITISKLNNEIDDLSRKVETAKVRLSAETKLRAQAEKEVKTLRRDLTEKKIHVTLSRSQKLNTFGGGGQPKNIHLSAY